jgi:hypothetical protein
MRANGGESQAAKFVFKRPVGAHQKDGAGEHVRARPGRKSEGFIDLQALEPARSQIAGQHEDKEEYPGQETCFPQGNKAGAQGIGLNKALKKTQASERISLKGEDTQGTERKLKAVVAEIGVPAAVGAEMGIQDEAIQNEQAKEHPAITALQRLHITADDGASGKRST